MLQKFFLLTLFVSNIAQAELAGDWIGWGQWTFRGEGEGAYCETMNMKWSESKESISIDQGLFDCGVVVMHLGKTAWSIKNGLLFDENNIEVGSYDQKRFEVTMPSPNENTTIHILVVRNANHYDYEEVWYNKDEKIYVITGRLFTSGEKK